jgi:hypothetical protein
MPKTKTKTKTWAWAAPWDMRHATYGVPRTNKSAFIGFYFQSAERHFRILSRQRVGLFVLAARVRDVDMLWDN